MSVTLYEPALKFLLEDPDGPVGLDLQRRSETLVRMVRENAQHIIRQIPESAIDYQISNTDLGLQSVIGFIEGGKWSEYLAAKEQREGVVFRPALEQGLDQT